jgi:hypothetical protein
MSDQRLIYVPNLPDGVVAHAVRTGGETRVWVSSTADAQDAKEAAERALFACQSGDARAGLAKPQMP